MTLPGPPRLLDVVDDLVAVLTEAMPEEVQVLDGPATSQAHLADELLVVGLTPDAQSAGYSSTLTSAPQLGRVRYVETFVVHCAISVYAGDTDVAERRARTRALLTAVHEALAGASLLGGDVQMLRLGTELASVPVQSEDGAAISTMFDVLGSIAS